MTDHTARNVDQAELNRLRAEIERLIGIIRMLIDNHDTGSYESEGQAFDEARRALEGKS